MTTLKQILKDTGYELEYQSGNIIGCVKEWLQEKQKEWIPNESGVIDSIANSVLNKLLKELEE